MPGKHESGSKRSFYLSVATSTLRGLILVALVVVGIVGLTKLFPQNTSAGVTPPPSVTVGEPSASGSPTTSPSPTVRRKARPKSQVTVQVLNGASKPGLAAEVTTRLNSDGYKTKTPANYSPKIETTIIYYQSDSQPEAQRLQRQRFPGSELRPAPATLPGDIDLQVIIGADQL